MDKILKSLFLYPIYAGDIKPHYSIQRAFEKHFDCFTYDWVNISHSIGLQKTQQDFIGLLKDRRPDYCFMQLQNPINMTVPIIREMAKYTKIINWSGDVRQSAEWYNWFEAIGKEIYLTLFTNNYDVELLRNRGVRADYLQIGFDTGWYGKKDKNINSPEIVFACNDYGSFPLSKYRASVVETLTNEFKERFKVYGNGWGNRGIQTRMINCAEEAQAYNNCKIAISVSNFNINRYYSDRLLRIMGCGAFPLSHEFEGMDLDFTEGHNIVSFKNLDELIEKCYYYLEHDSDRNLIAENAYNTAHSKCTWDIRCQELIQLLNKYDA